MSFIDRIVRHFEKKKWSGTGKFTCAKIPKVTGCESFGSTLYIENNYIPIITISYYSGFEDFKVIYFYFLAL
jgi:hypothetical protein